MAKYLNSGLTTEQYARRLEAVREEIDEAARLGGRVSDTVRVMAVTKYVGADAVNRVCAAGVRLIGENREQSLTQKYPELEREGLDIHFIGRLQRNKAARVVKMVSTVQSLDSEALAGELDRQAGLCGKNLSVLVEVNVGRDPNKAGVSPDALAEMVDALRAYRNLTVRGLMAILPLGAEEREAEKYFSQMNGLYVDIRAKNRDNIGMDCLSMGMSGDYKLAVKHGSTMVRLGTVLFG